MLRNVLLLISCCTFVFGQERDTCPGRVNQVIAATQREICPEKRLDYAALYCETVDSVIVIKGETTNPVFRDSVVVRCRRAFTQVRDESVVLPEPSLAENGYGVMRVSTGYLRRQPDHDMEMISQGIMGESVRLLKKRGAFYFCKLSDGYLGWMEAASIEAMNLAKVTAWNNADKVIYLRGVGLIYNDKDRKSDPISDIVGAGLVIKIAKQGKWLHVQLPDGRKGYIPADEMMDYAKFCAMPQPDGKALVHTAKSFLGHPYLWGGNSAKGVDCSGFTKTVYRMHHIELPRDANMQVHCGVRVSFDSTYRQIHAGDLLFFGADSNRITHVGIFLGNKQFIHSDGYVRVNSFDPQADNFSPYRVRGLQSVRRILKE